MILGIDKVKIDLTKRYFEIYKENKDFLEKKISNDLNMMSLDLVNIPISESEKEEIINETKKEISIENNFLNSINSEMDTQIINLIGSLKNNLLKLARN